MKQQQQQQQPLRKSFQYSNLQQKPPPSISVLRDILHAEGQTIERCLRDLEVEFYNQQSALHYHRSEAAILKSVLDSHRVNEITSFAQLQAIVQMARSPEAEEKKISTSTADHLLQLQNKLLAFLPGKFDTLVGRLRHLCSLCERYLLPFYSLDDDTQVDTGRQYAQNVQIWCHAVLDRCKLVYHLPQLFIRNGVSLDALGGVAVDILERSDLLRCPFMGMFSDTVDQVRSANATVLKWIHYDQQYTEFLKNDSITLKERKVELEQGLKNTQNQVHMLQYRVKGLHNYYAKVKVEYETLMERETELMYASESIALEINSKKVDLEVSEFRREEVRKKCLEEEEVDSRKRSKDTQMELEGLNEVIRSLRFRLPQLQRQKVAIDAKLHWIEEKAKQVEEVKAKIPHTEEALKQEKRKVIEYEHELDVVRRSMTRCEEIHRYKTSGSVLERIFYGMPITVNNKSTMSSLEFAMANSPRRGNNPDEKTEEPSKLQATTTKLDELEDVFLKVAADIGKDWVQLYRALPFIPSRGTRIIDADIQELERSVLGEANQFLAIKLFQRWRRFHRRARVDDLLSALSAIGRLDLVQVIKLHTKVETHAVQSQEEDAIPSYLPRDLIPFYKDILKYDRMRAAAVAANKT